MTYSLLSVKSGITANMISAAMDLPPHQHGSNPLLLRFMHAVAFHAPPHRHQSLNASPSSPVGHHKNSPTSALRPRMDFRSLMFCHSLFKVSQSALT